MSVDINWETLTGGPDGEALAETIREFIHERFQQISLPKLIRSVNVRSFEFGEIPPEIVLKDICEPLPDFYENDEGDGNTDEENQSDDAKSRNDRDVNVADSTPTKSHPGRGKGDSRRPPELPSLNISDDRGKGHGPRPHLMGGTSNLGYFNLPMSAGMPGTNTPLAAVAGAHFQQRGQHREERYQHSSSLSSISPASADSPPSRPLSESYFDQHRPSVAVDGSEDRTPRSDHASVHRSSEDLQVVFHATYSGDVKLSMTAEVFLDYPMPSFVGIPLKLNITGVTFNGVGLIAYIKKRAHLCFLSPEDAEALVGGDVSPPHATEDGATNNSSTHSTRVGRLLEEIKIESEMGETGEGKQVLKNVGKIEKFILEQVQRIFEEEFVYPSYWTFLV